MSEREPITRSTFQCSDETESISYGLFKPTPTCKKRDAKFDVTALRFVFVLKKFSCETI